MKKHYSLFGIILFTFSSLSGQILNDKYSLANSCYSVTYKHKKKTKDFIFKDVDSKYYLKPAALGEYMLYGKNNKILTRKESFLWYTLTFDDSKNADDGSIWIPEPSSNNKFRLKNKRFGNYLGRNFLGFTGNAKKKNAIELEFFDNENCAIFPEASVSAEQSGTLKGLNSNGTVWGMADIHLHLFGNESYGGYFNHGAPFSPYGIEQALDNCNTSHGDSGLFDIYASVTGSQQNPLEHNTNGYPTFDYWPSHIDFNHQKGYYQWLNRARLGGLRLITTLSVQNEVLNKVYNELAKQLKPILFDTLDDPKDIYDSMEAHNIMVEKATQLMNYVDAQEGGPGKGWFRIVHTPAEARNVIAQGKLAVVMGMELEAPFNCIKTRDGASNCTREYIEEQLDKYENKGISHIFLNHHWDNDFGGARQFEKFLELSNIAFNDHVFEWEAADHGAEGIFNVHKPLVAENLGDINDLVLDVIRVLFNVNALPAQLPDSETGNYRNTKGLNTLGKVFIEECMQRGIMIDFGHSSKAAVEDAYELLDQYDYPPLFTHSASFNSMKHVLQRNGVLSPMFKANGFEGHTYPCEFPISSDFIELVKVGNEVNLENKENHVGIPFTSDLFAGTQHMNGPRFNNQTNPCNRAQSNPVSYPFTSHDGAVTFNRQQTGERIFDINSDGLVHLGLLPDLIQDIKNQGYTNKDVDILFNGAEEYLRLWERSIEASKRVKDSNLKVTPLEKSPKKTENTTASSEFSKNRDTVNEEENNETFIYPTLIENTFNIKTEKPTILEVSIYDIQGKVYYQKTIHYNNISPKSIDNLGTITSGVLFIKIKDLKSLKNVIYKVIKK
ncbi:membrane dipeptidase [Tenacibaculum agarivorans]|uniref:membrane dipeptidase n=1 Tax=Tenacibaculum agarivorans TaxID=1908389 RepID=UPI00094BB0C7|nr:membrane dipeptidase [Tenacibaculum agarivorans]